MTVRLRDRKRPMRKAWRRKYILIVDDNPLIRRAVRAIFEAHSDFQVYGEASDGQDAIFKTQQLHPDLVILDMAMPVMNGIEAARILSTMMPQVFLILLTAHDLAFFEPEARAAGIRVVLSKAEAAIGLIPRARSLLESANSRDAAGVEN